MRNRYCRQMEAEAWVQIPLGRRAEVHRHGCERVICLICREDGLKGLGAMRLHPVHCLPPPTRDGQARPGEVLAPGLILSLRLECSEHLLSPHSAIPGSGDAEADPPGGAQGWAGPLVASPASRYTFQAQAGWEGSPGTMSLRSFMLFYPLPGERLPVAFTMPNKKPFFFSL